MKRKLSSSTTKKEYIREVWNSYIKKFMSRMPNDEGYDSLSILTLSTTGFLDVRKYLEIENVTIDNVVVVTDQGQLKSEFELFLDEIGTPRSEVNRFFYSGKVESHFCKNTFKRPMDIYNLDYSGLFFSASKESVLGSYRDPQGITHFFDFARRFERPFTLFLTNKIDTIPERELSEYEELNRFLSDEILERIIVLDSDPESARLKSLVAILATTCAIAATRGFRVNRIFPFIYRPEDTYTIQMTILEFSPSKKSILQSFLEPYAIDDLQAMTQAIRDSIPRVEMIE